MTIGDLFEEIFGRERPPSAELALFFLAGNAGREAVLRREEWTACSKGRRLTAEEVSRAFEQGAAALLAVAPKIEGTETENSEDSE